MSFTLCPRHKWPYCICWLSMQFIADIFSSLAKFSWADGYLGRFAKILWVIWVIHTCNNPFWIPCIIEEDSWYIVHINYRVKITPFSHILSQTKIVISITRWQNLYTVISKDVIDSILYVIIVIYRLPCYGCVIKSLQWRQNECDGVWNHQLCDCLFNPLFKAQIKKNYQSLAPLAFVREIHRWPAYSPHKVPVTRKIFQFDDIIILRLGHICLEGPLVSSQYHILSKNCLTHNTFE